MNPQSALQQRFPLSPKKFWKKMFEKLAGWYILVFMGVVIDVIIIATTNSSYDKATSFILWGALVLMLVFLAIITSLYAWYIRTYIKTYFYDGEEHFITIKKGVFAPAEIHVQWQKIQDVYVDQDIIDRIIGLYDVHIASATAASGIKAHIDGINQASADGLKKFLLDKVSNAGRGNFQNSTTVPTPDGVSGEPVPAPVINLKEEISSTVYPLSRKWTVVTLLSRLIGSFTYPIFFYFIFFGRTKDFSIADYWVYLVLGWLALGILTMIVRTITLFLWKKNYAFNFTADHIYYREGVISLSEKHMPYSSIQDVTVKQGVIERFFGLAKVVIENAAQQQVVISNRGQRVTSFAGIILQGLSLADANKITNVLKSTVLGRNNSRYGL